MPGSRVPAIPRSSAPRTRGRGAHVPDDPHSARQRLILGAARIFAEKGYDAASTREICLAAEANVAAIHYHFGDKAGLYRAVLWTSIERVVTGFPTLNEDAHQPLEAAMRALLSAFIAPMAADEATQWFSRIHQRETVEPTPMMQDVIAEFVLPHFRGLVALLARHCGVAEPDDELHRLAFAITALVNDYCLSQHWMRVLAPGLLTGADAMERTVEHLSAYACALVRAETLRRQAPAGAASPALAP